MLKSVKQNKIIRKTWLYLRCIFRFGLPLGHQVFYKITQRPDKDLISLTLPGYKHKIFLRPDTSDIDVFETVFVALRFNNNQEPLNPKLIVDAGANLGLVSIFFANKYPNSIVYALEPENSNFDILVKNTTGYKNIRPVNSAIWKNNSHLCIENLNAEKWAFRVIEKTTNGNQLLAITVIDLLAMAKMDFIDIFKIDIEGAEKELFEENYETWINKVGFFIIELHEGLREGSKKSFYSAIKATNYHECIKGENHFIKID